MSDIKNVIVAGAGGHVGSYVVKSLLAANFNLTILSRPSSQSVFPDGIKVVRAEYTDVPALKEALQGQDAVISTVGVGAMLDQINMIDAAEAVSVKRFFLGEFGNHTQQKRLPEVHAFGAAKRTVLEHAKEKAAANPKFTWTAAATGVFIDWSIKRFPTLGYVIPTRTATIYDSGNEAFTGTTMAGIAQAVTGSLQNPGPTANKFLRIRSIEVTQNKILAAFEEATGEKWTVEHQKSEDVLARGRAKLVAGDRGAALDLVIANIMGEGEGRGMVATKKESDSELVGVPEVDIVDIVRDILAFT